MKRRKNDGEYKMKKAISLMISVFLTIVSVSGVSALDSDTKIRSCIEMIRSFVYTFDKKVSM